MKLRDSNDENPISIPLADGRTSMPKVSQSDLKCPFMEIYSVPENKPSTIFLDSFSKQQLTVATLQKKLWVCSESDVELESNFECQTSVKLANLNSGFVGGIPLNNNLNACGSAPSFGGWNDTSSTGIAITGMDTAKITSPLTSNCVDMKLESIFSTPVDGKKKKILPNFMSTQLLVSGLAILAISMPVIAIPVEEASFQPPNEGAEPQAFRLLFNGIPPTKPLFRLASLTEV